MVQLRARSIGGATRVSDLHESGPLRVRFPKTRTPDLQGILVNSAGGIACGDAFETSVFLDTDSRFLLTTTAAEKIYRSDGPVSTILNRVEIASGARLVWLPQETILFDDARLSRRFEADLAEDAELLIGEIIVFGRAAHGESISDGQFHDAWRVRRAGRLVYADALRFDGPIGALMQRSAIGGGARALATIVDFAALAESRLDEARALLESAGANATGGVEAGASAWNGHLVIRALAPDVGAIRTVLARFLTAYRGEPMPRVWQSG